MSSSAQAFYAVVSVLLMGSICRADPTVYSFPSNRWHSVTQSGEYLFPENTNYLMVRCCGNATVSAENILLKKKAPIVECDSACDMSLRTLAGTSPHQAKSLFIEVRGPSEIYIKTGFSEEHTREGISRRIGESQLALARAREEGRIFEYNEQRSEEFLAKERQIEEELRNMFGEPFERRRRNNEVQQAAAEATSMAHAQEVNERAAQVSEQARQACLEASASISLAMGALNSCQDMKCGIKTGGFTPDCLPGCIDEYRQGVQIFILLLERCGAIDPATACRHTKMLEERCAIDDVCTHLRARIRETCDSREK